MRNCVVLDWLFPVDNGGSPILEYEIQVKDAMTGEWSTCGRTPAVDIGPHCACPHTLATTTFTVTNLQTYQYLFRVFAINAIGRSLGAETSWEAPEGLLHSQ